MSSAFHPSRLLQVAVPLMLLVLTACTAALPQRMVAPEPDRAEAALRELGTLPMDEQVATILEVINSLRTPEHTEEDRRTFVERLAATPETQPAVLATGEHLLDQEFGAYWEPEFVQALAASTEPTTGGRLLQRVDDTDVPTDRRIVYLETLARWVEADAARSLPLVDDLTRTTFRDGDLEKDQACALYEPAARSLTALAPLRPLRQNRLTGRQADHAEHFLREGPPACAAAAVGLLMAVDWDSIPQRLRLVLSERPDALANLPVTQQFHVLRALLANDIEPPAALTASVLTAPEVGDRQVGEVLFRMLPHLFSFHPEGAHIEDAQPLHRHPLVAESDATEADLAARDAILQRARNTPRRLVDWVDPVLDDHCPLALHLLDDPELQVQDHRSRAIESLKTTLEVGSEDEARAAAWCLRGLRTESAASVATWLLRHENAVMRRMAVRLAAKAGHDAVLEEAVLDADPAVRRHALQECCATSGAAPTLLYAYERYALPWTTMEPALRRTGGFIGTGYADLVTDASGLPITGTTSVEGRLPALEQERHCDALHAKLAAYGEENPGLRMLDDATTTEEKQALLAALLRCAMVSGDIDAIQSLTDTYRIDDIAEAHAAARHRESLLSLAASVDDPRVLPLMLELGFQHPSTALSPLFAAYESCNLLHIPVLADLGHSEPPPSFHDVLPCGLGLWEHVRRRGARVDGWSEKGPPLVRVADLALPDAALKIRYLLNHGADAYAPSAPFSKETTSPTVFDRLYAWARPATAVTFARPATDGVESTLGEAESAPYSLPLYSEALEALLAGIFANHTVPALSGCAAEVALRDGVGQLHASPGEGAEEAPPCGTVRLSDLDAYDLTGNGDHDVLVHLTHTPLDGQAPETWLYVYRTRPAPKLLWSKASSGSGEGVEVALEADRLVVIFPGEAEDDEVGPYREVYEWDGDGFEPVDAEAAAGEG